MSFFAPQSPSLLAGRLLFLLAASPSALQGPQRAASVADVLGRTSQWQEVPAGIEELTAFGAEALPVLFDSLVQGLGAQQRALVVGTFRRLPSAALWEHLQTVAATSVDVRARLEGLRLTTALGSKQEMRLVLRLAAHEGASGRVERALREACEEALDSILEREHSSAQLLAQLFGEAHPALQSGIVSAIACLAEPEAARLLAGLLGKSPPVDPLVLSAIARIEPVPPNDARVAEKLGEYLRAPQREHKILAARAAEHLGDERAVVDLVPLLADSDGDVRRFGHAALVAITGLDAGKDQPSWQGWHAEQLQWWQFRSGPCRDALLTGTPEQAVQAVYEVARRRWNRAGVLEILLAGLVRPERGLLVTLCRVLGSIGSEEILPQMAPLLEHAEPEVRAAVRAVMTRLSGHPLPPDPSTWEGRTHG